MWILWFGLLPLLLWVVLEMKHFKFRKTINRIPGLPTLPLLGNAHQIGQNPIEMLNNLFSWWYKFGQDNYRLWIGYSSNVMISNPEDIEFILRSSTMIQKADIYDLFKDFIGHGLVTAFGSSWHKQRKMITPSFHFKVLRNFHDTMNRILTKLIEKLQEVSSGDSIFDIQNMFDYFSLDVVCETSMGLHVTAMDDPNSTIVRALKDNGYYTNKRLFHPFKRNKYLYKFYPDYYHFRKVLRTLKDFTYKIIENRREAHTKAQAAANSYEATEGVLVDNLLNATIDNNPLTNQEIFEEVATFVFAGHDTTATGLSFSVLLLSRHPDIQEKVFEEQKAIMGSDLKRDATFNEISEMKYLDLFLKEVERLYPSIPLIGRQTEKDYNINGTLIPKGTNLTLFLMALGYNEKNFPDPYRVDPERFNNRTFTTSAFEYVPFSGGLRNCIGQKFALLEIKTTISKIVRHFEILPPLDELISMAM